MLFSPFFFVCTIRQVFLLPPQICLNTNSQHSFRVSSVMKEHQLFFMQWWHSTTKITMITGRKKAAVLDGRNKRRWNKTDCHKCQHSEARSEHTEGWTECLIRRYKMCANFQGRHEQTKNTQQMTGEVKFDLAYWRNLSADEDACEVLLFVLLYVGIITK